MNNKTPFLGCAAIISLAALFASPVSAEPSYFSASTIIQNETVYGPASSYTTNREADVQTTGDDSSASFGAYDDFGWQSASASASLATGRLRALSFASDMTALGDSRLTLTSIASFGDTFALHDSSGAPFVVAGDTASFNLEITGRGDVWGGTLGRAPTATAFIELFILQPGSLSGWVPNSYGLLTPQVDDIITVFQWGATATSTSALDYSTYGTTYETHTIPVLSDGDTATATFTALSEFDWIVRLNAGINLASGDPNAWASSDFYHTLELSFSAPEGITTQSASGVFPATVAAAVPEPQAWLMLLVGLDLVSGVAPRHARRA